MPGTMQSTWNTILHTLMTVLFSFSFSMGREVLVTEFQLLCMLGKCSSTELYPHPFWDNILLNFPGSFQMLTPSASAPKCVLPSLALFSILKMKKLRPKLSTYLFQGHNLTLNLCLKYIIYCYSKKAAWDLCLKLDLFVNQ